MRTIYNESLSGLKDILTSPFTGTVIPLSQVDDEIFSSGALGGGFAVLPEEGALYSPADGLVEVISDTLHSLMITTNSGAELLVHVGKDTVGLNGKGFNIHCERGQRVSQGELLMTVDMEKMEKEGRSLVTPVCISNSSKFILVLEPVTHVQAGSKVMTIFKSGF